MSEDVTDKSPEQMCYNLMVQINDAFNIGDNIRAFKIIESVWCLMRNLVYKKADRNMIDKQVDQLEPKIDVMHRTKSEVVRRDMAIKIKPDLRKVRKNITGIYSSIFGEVNYTPDMDKEKGVSSWLVE